jgi:DNA polymerase-3 subunit delta
MSDALDDALAEIKAGKARPFYLVHGEEFLARRAAEALAEALVPKGKADLNYVQVDAANGAGDVARQLDTVPMFRGTKVVFVDGADLLLEKRDVARELARAKELWGQPARKKDAARRLLALVQPAGWTWKELDPEDPASPPKTRWKKETGLDPTGEDREFFSAVAKYAKEIELKPPREEGELLRRSLAEGPPKGNHLILLCSEFDTRHAIVRTVQERGLVIERAVERSGRGRGVESIDIGELAKEVLGPLGKKLSPGAAGVLKDRVGEAMRQMASELEKLAVFVGDKTTIEQRDVELLVAPLREEEFWELGNALGEGDGGRALKLIDEELARGKHALMIAGSIYGSIRRMALDAARYQRLGAMGGRESAFEDYQHNIFPRYAEIASGDRAPSPWMAWQNYRRARRHGTRKLLRTLALCAEVDVSLKSGAPDRIALGRLVFALCGTA